MPPSWFPGRRLAGTAGAEDPLSTHPASNPDAPVAAKYLLPCSCGEPTRVSPSQAGGKVTCACGITLDAPPLRQLRELPLADEDDRTTAGWGFRQGFVTAGVVLAALLAAGGGWIAYNTPDGPRPLDMGLYLNVLDQNIDGMTPGQGYELWVNGYKTLAVLGFSDEGSQRSDALQQYVQTQKIYSRGLLIAAGAVLAGSLVAAVALPR